MTDPPGGHDDEAGDVHIVETTPTGEAHGDVIPGRPRRPPTRWSLRPSWLAALLAVALAAGIGIGYLIGRPDHHHAAAAPTTPLPAGSALAEVPQLTAPGDLCYGALPGRRLMLGTRVVNSTPRPLVLTGLQGVFPLGGFQVVDSQVGQCDNNAIEAVDGHRVEPSAEVWLTLIVDVTGTSCPGALPVQFALDYTVDGTPHRQVLPGFSDLSSVPFPGCPTPS
jgi:hypothetical protein